MANLHFSHDTVVRIVASAVIVFIIYLVRAFVLSRVNKRYSQVTLRHNQRKLVVYTTSIIAIFILLGIWVQKLNFGVVFSIVGAGLVIALTDVILNFAGWIYLVLRKPFEIGQRIQIGEIKGDVIDVRGFYITLLEIENWVQEEQSTGRIVPIPNNFLFRQAVYNYTKGFNFIWNEVKIPITFESNYKQAKEIALKYLEAFHLSWAKDLEEKIRSAQDSYAIYYRNLTPTVYVRIIDNGILLSLRYLVEPHKRRYSENLIFEQILDAFANQEDINFAYTTYRLTK